MSQRVRQPGVVAATVRTDGRAHGFTAIELLITIGIAAIFASLALPSFVDTVRSTRMQTTAEMLQTDLLMARREAIKRNQRVLLCPARANAVVGTDDLCLQDKSKWGDGWVLCYVNTAAATTTCNTPVSDSNPNPIIRRGKLDATISIDAALGPKYIAFDPNGKTSNDTFTAANPNPASKLKIAGNWSGASASWFLCTQGSGVISVKKKAAADASDPC